MNEYFARKNLKHPVLRNLSSKKDRRKYSNFQLNYRFKTLLKFEISYLTRKNSQKFKL